MRGVRAAGAGALRRAGEPRPVTGGHILGDRAPRTCRCGEVLGRVLGRGGYVAPAHRTGLRGGVVGGSHGHLCRCSSGHASRHLGGLAVVRGRTLGRGSRGPSGTGAVRTDHVVGAALAPALLSCGCPVAVRVTAEREIVPAWTYRRTATFTLSGRGTRSMGRWSVRVPARWRSGFPRSRS